MPTTISHVFLQCDPPHLHRVERSVSLPLWTQVGPVPALTDRMGWVQLLAVSPWHPRAVLFQFTSAASDQNTVLYFLSERERALPARCPLVSSSVWLWGSVSLTQSSMVLGAWFAGHEIEPFCRLCMLQTFCGVTSRMVQWWLLESFCCCLLRLRISALPSAVTEPKFALGWGLPFLPCIPPSLDCSLFVKPLQAQLKGSTQSGLMRTQGPCTSSCWAFTWKISQ